MTIYVLSGTITNGVSGGTTTPIRTADANEYIKLSIANNSSNKVSLDVVYDGNVIKPLQVLNPKGNNTNVATLAMNLAAGKTLSLVTYSSDPIVWKADGGNI